MTFCEQVKFVRKKLLLSQEALARELNVSFATLNRWELNKCKPGLITQKAFIEFCKKHNIMFGEEI